MSLNLLIVDDSSVMRTMIVKTMQMSGFDLAAMYQAANGFEGLQVLEDTPIDLVLLDLHMPLMSGEEMLKRMQADKVLKHTPVVLISTEGSQTRIQRMQRNPKTRFIRKPFSPEKVRSVVQDVLFKA